MKQKTMQAKRPGMG